MKDPLFRGRGRLLAPAFLAVGAGADGQVVARVDGDRIAFATVEVGASKTLRVEASTRTLVVRTTTLLDGTEFAETLADNTQPGALGFGGVTDASGSDRPQTAFGAAHAPPAGWASVVPDPHRSVPVNGTGQVNSGIDFGAWPSILL